MNDATSRPAVWRCTLSTAANMSSTRCRHSLGGTDRLGQHARPELGLDRVLHDQIDAPAEDGFQPALHPEEIEEPDRPIEGDQKVHIAIKCGVAARDRAE